MTLTTEKSNLLGFFVFITIMLLVIGESLVLRWSAIKNRKFRINIYNGYNKIFFRIFIFTKKKKNNELTNSSFQRLKLT